MKFFVLLLFLVCSSKAQDDEFPENFLFGVGSASYQIEGGWNAGGKGENIWDFITHNNPEFVNDSSNGDVACNSYNLYERDVELIKDMGAQFYRFSLSWSRIFPTGHVNSPNAAGIAYYNNLINALLENDIQPFVTIYHWDLPQPLHELGGWPNPALADLYADFADKVFELYGDRVKNWITFNEPFQICEEGYSLGSLAPGYNQLGIGGYLCGHTLLLAHAKAYQIYNDKYRSEQNGRVGITVHGAWAGPATTSQTDIDAAELRMQMTVGWFLDPIYAPNGNYPEKMQQRIEALSAVQNFKRSRLPTFTNAERLSLMGSSDFLGLNHYGSYECTVLENPADYASHQTDVGTSCHFNEDWEETSAPWFSVSPEGLKSVLVWLKNRYNNPEVIITESGYADSDGALRDCGRVNYYNDYLKVLLEAIHEEECQVTGYTAWSIMDLFEWNYGHLYTFGLHQVDFEVTAKTRTPKMSSFVYKNIIETRQIDEGFAPEGYEGCGACAISVLNTLIGGILALLFIYIRQF